MPAYIGRDYKIITIQDLVLSGQPLNIKASVDNAFAVIIIDGHSVLNDTITAYAAQYANDDGKVLFVTIDPSMVEDNKFALLVGDESILSGISNDHNAQFWQSLREKLQSMASDPNPYL